MISELKSYRFASKVKTPVYMQMEATECGAASLGIILAYFGRFVPRESLRKCCNVTRDGSSVQSIIDGAKEHGLEAKAYMRGEDAVLSQTKFPVIVYWNNSHFLVLEGCKNDKAYLNDPEFGRRIVPVYEFKLSYSKVIIEFNKTNTFKKDKYKSNTFSLIYKSIGNSKVSYTLLALFTLLLFIPGLIIPVFSQIFIDQHLIQANNYIVFPLIAFMLLFLMAQVILVYFQKKILIRISQKISVILSIKYITHLLKLSSNFFLNRHPGDLIQRLESNEEVAQVISGGLALNIVNLIQVFMFGAIMILYSWQLSLIVFIYIALNIIIYLITKNLRFNVNREEQVSQSKLLSEIIKGVQSLELIKASSSEDEFYNNWSRKYTKLMHTKQLNFSSFKWLSILPGFTIQTGSAATLGVGAWLISIGQLSIGQLIAFQLISLSFANPISTIISFGDELEKLKAIFERLYDTLNYKTEIDNIGFEEKLNIQKFNGYLEIKNVTFGYNKKRKPLINNINLKIQPGNLIALVGSSGSGKSTISKLISGIYKPWSGNIYFDGHASISRLEMRYSLSVVNQNINLFEGTLRENITFWDSKAYSDDQIIRALKIACIYEVIKSKPDGLDTYIAANGSNFSGGERQRIEIARAIITNPSVIILDEATSALESGLEKDILTNISRIGFTSIVITHRVSSIKNADNIFLIDNGAIVSEGHYSDLIIANKLFASFVAKDEINELP